MKGYNPFKKINKIIMEDGEEINLEESSILRADMDEYTGTITIMLPSYIIKTMLKNQQQIINEGGDLPKLY